MSKKFRVMVPGSHSVYVGSRAKADQVARDVMARNGFGYIYTIGNGPSLLVARFEPYCGIVEA